MNKAQPKVNSCLHHDQSGREYLESDGEQAHPSFIPLSEKQTEQALRNADSTILPADATEGKLENLARDLAEGGATHQIVVRLDPPPIKQVLQGRAATRRVRSNSDIRSIVIHTPEGGIAATLSVLEEHRASFDFYLPLNGDLYRCNDYRNYIAWQAGDWYYNQRSIGIEQGDYAAKSGEFPDDHYRRLASLVAYLIQTTSTPFRYVKNYGEDGIIDHRTITPNDRDDPGPTFKRQRLLDLVSGYLSGTEPSPWPSTGDMTWQAGQIVALQGAIARQEASRTSSVIRQLEAGKIYATDGFTTAGQTVQGSSRWYHLAQSAGFGWVHSSGGVYTQL